MVEEKHDSRQAGKHDTRVVAESYILLAGWSRGCVYGGHGGTGPGLGF